MSKLIGYRVITIHSEISIPLFEKSINKYLKDEWTLHGTTINRIVNGVNRFSQTMVKYSDSTEPRITQYRLIASNAYTPAFEAAIIEAVKNTWTFFGHTWYTIDSKGRNYYSQALVQFDSFDDLVCLAASKV
jgi:hypothetical protein